MVRFFNFLISFLVFSPLNNLFIILYGTLMGMELQGWHVDEGVSPCFIT